MNPQSNDLQFSDDSVMEPVDIVIGLDFGTSCTKIVIRAPYFVGTPSYAIPFGRLGHAGNEFLLPTRPYFDARGMLRLSDSFETPRFPALKMRVLDNPQARPFEMADGGVEYNNMELATGYLGFVLRNARRWFIENTRTVFGKSRLHWNLNVGTPSSGFGDEAQVVLLKKIAKAGWRVSLLSPDITLLSCQAALDQQQPLSTQSDGIEDDDVNIIPEVSAQVIGYCESDKSSPGIHMLVDVGAGTVDVCCFHFSKDKSKNKHTIYASKVERIGAFELHSQRVLEMKERLVQWLKDFGSKEDPIEPIPDAAKDYVPDPQNIESIAQEFKADEQVAGKCKISIENVLFTAYYKKDPNSQSWETGITTFVSGGGGTIDLYRNCVHEVDNRWKGETRTEGLSIDPLPIPAIFTAPGLPQESYHRLSVAYGLSFTRDALGQYIPEYEVGDIPRQNEAKATGAFVDLEDRYPSKDQM